MIIAAFALPYEVRPAVRRGVFRTERVAGYEIYRGDVGDTDVVLFASGVGSGHAYKAASTLIASLKPSIYISAGLCGSIAPDARHGDVFVADEILSLRGGEVERVYGSDDGLVAPPDVSTGMKHSGLICSDSVITSADRKRELYEKNPSAMIVDMESAGAARAAGESGLRFMAVKAVSDAHDEDLPVDFNLFTNKKGGMDIARLVMHVLTHPRTMPPLIKLSRNSSAAADNLAGCLAELLPQLADIV